MDSSPLLKTNHHLLTLIPRDGGCPDLAGQLPLPLTTLISRAHDVVAAMDLLQRPEARLRALNSPGRDGRTRLALEVDAPLSA